MTGPDGAEVIESISAGSTHVLPVCTEAEPETANILDKDTQAVLRKGAYDFTRYGGRRCSDDVSGRSPEAEAPETGCWLAWCLHYANLS